MPRPVTIEDVQEALTELVADGVIRVVEPCVVSVPASWRDLLPASAFAPIEPVYRLTDKGLQMLPPGEST